MHGQRPRRQGCGWGAPAGFLISVAWTALVWLTAGCEGTVSDTDGSVNVTIAPDTVTVEGGSSNVAFRVSGGFAPYTWSVDDTALGTVTAAGNTAVYVSNATAGTNFVVATDAQSNSVTATVSQSEQAE